MSAIAALSFAKSFLDRWARHCTIASIHWLAATSTCSHWWDSICRGLIEHDLLKLESPLAPALVHADCRHGPWL